MYACVILTWWPARWRRAAFPAGHADSLRSSSAVGASPHRSYHSSGTSRRRGRLWASGWRTAGQPLHIQGSLSRSRWPGVSRGEGMKETMKWRMRGELLRSHKECKEVRKGTKRGVWKGWRGRGIKGEKRKKEMKWQEEKWGKGCWENGLDRRRCRWIGEWRRKERIINSIQEKKGGHTRRQRIKWATNLNISGGIHPLEILSLLFVQKGFVDKQYTHCVTLLIPGESFIPVSSVPQDNSIIGSFTTLWYYINAKILKNGWEYIIVLAYDAASSNWRWQISRDPEQAIREGCFFCFFLYFTNHNMHWR